jgi:YgiT-type zinc finger domain-containing protein
MKSNKCSHPKMQQTQISKQLPIAGKMINVVNAPARICVDCGEVHFEGKFLLNLEKEVLNKQKKAA